MTEINVGGFNGEEVTLRQLVSDVNDERGLGVFVSADNLHAYVSVTPGAQFVQLQRVDVTRVVSQAGIVYGVLDEGLSYYLTMANGEKPFTGYFEIACGVPPREGENGSIEFHVQPTSKEPKYDVSDAGSVDFKQPNLIENCFSGQLVATILPPGTGKPGKDVFGGLIAPNPGTPITVVAGAGIKQSDNGRDFTSEMDGRLIYEDGELSISSLLEIAHDIDYSVGNVDFIGKVIIRGSLLDGFYVSAKRGVELFGDVGAARILSEGDVTISGGIKGKNAAMVACRNLTARYIDDASVEATGNVSATKEIMNSSVKALGRVSVSNGAIIGGLVCGFHGVEADTLGSDMGVATKIMAGLDWTRENRKDDIRRQVAEYMDRIQSAKVVLDRVFVDTDLARRMGDDHKVLLADITSELRELRDLMMELLEERARIDGSRQVGTVSQINARKMLFMGVMAQFGRGDCQVKDSIKGPVSILPGGRNGTLEIKALADLPKLPEQPKI